MENKVLTQEETEVLNSISSQRAKIMGDFGYLEYHIQELELQKQNLIESLEELKAKELNLSIQLENKYGKIQVNAVTGEIMPLG
jgi:hypothetical protein